MQTTRISQDRAKQRTARGAIAVAVALGAFFLAAMLQEGATAWSAEVDGDSPATTVRTRDELIRAVQGAKPGATVLVAPGTYRGGLSFAGLRGEKGRPITLAAADPKRPPVFKGGASCLHLTNAVYVEIRDFVLTGATSNGLNIDDGGSVDRPAHHVVLRGLKIHDIGPKGNRDGVKLSGVDDFLVESCTVERWGSGGSAIDMVGCHDGRVASCTFRHQDAPSGNGVQTKGGSRNITISRCRFENAGGRAVNLGGSTGLPYFRPRRSSYEAKDILVEDCTFRGSMAPVAFVGVDGAVVRYNTIYRPTRWVVRILQESRDSQFVACRNGLFTNNLIVFRSDELRTVVNVGAGTTPESFKFEKNHWYCLDRPQASKRRSPPINETASVYGRDPEFVNERDGDLRLKSSSPVRDAGVRPPSRN